MNYKALRALVFTAIWASVALAAAALVGCKSKGDMDTDIDVQIQKKPVEQCPPTTTEVK